MPKSGSNPRIVGIIARGAEESTDTDSKIIKPATKIEITPPEERNPTSGLIGLFTTGHTDLATRAKEIARGRDKDN